MIFTKHQGYGRDGRRVLPFDKGDAPAPDPLIGQASVRSVQLGEDSLKWMQDQFNESKPQREEAIKIALDQARTQTDTAKKQNVLADEAAARYKTTFQPIEDKIAADAQGYDTAARREQEAGQAMADVGTQGDMARETMVREQASRGVDPSSGNSLAALARTAVAEAAAKAASGNQARQRVETIGAAKLADVAALGKGIISNNATQTQIGLQAGNSSVGNAQVPGAVTAGGAALMQQGVNTAMQGNIQGGNLALNNYNSQVKANESDTAGLMSGLANLGMAGAKLYGLSDENMKTDVKPVTGRMALSMIRDSKPGKSWRYKDGAVAGDDGSRRIGGMAQDAQRAMGDDVAPDGKKIDLVSANGIAMTAIMENDRRITRLENARKGA